MIKAMAMRWASFDVPLVYGSDRSAASGGDFGRYAVHRVPNGAPANRSAIPEYRLATLSQLGTVASPSADDPVDAT